MGKVSSTLDQKIKLLAIWNQNSIVVVMTADNEDDDLRRNEIDFGFKLGSGCGEWGTSQVDGKDVMCLLERSSLTQRLIPPTRVVLPELIQKSWWWRSQAFTYLITLVCRCGHKFMDKFSRIQNLVYNFCFISIYYWFPLKFLAVTSNCIKNIYTGFDSVHNLSYQNIELRYGQKKNSFGEGYLL